MSRESETSSTRRSLVRRLAALLALTCAGVLALLTAYAGVHSPSGALRTATAPAMLDVAAAQTALELADSAADSSLTSDRAGLAGTGEEYRTQISAANQSLARAAESHVAGDSGRQTLQTVAGLVTAYTGWIEQADRWQDQPVLRDAYLAYAGSMLRDDGGVLARLTALQAEQRQVLRRQVSFGAWQWLCWSVALALLLALAWLLVDTQRYLRRRFRRRFNPWLAGACVLLLALLPLAVFSAQTHGGMERCEQHLTAVVDQQQRPGTGHTAAVRAGQKIRDTAEKVGEDMSGTRWRGALIGWIPVAGLLIGALAVRGLQPRIAEYRFRR
ncbi:hypothetical protein ACIQGZ_21530 [Streptomyces sp. NPDC092296]|uniref:hypothetical protein n=1 Tax=Streptomyces sp. NPDC092296 TaxID=3366012 RepID=UPI00381735DE